MVLQHGDRTVRRVAVTFDSNMTSLMRRRLADGTATSYCNHVLLEWLDASRLPATVFLTGYWVESYPQESRTLAQLPTVEIGSHGYSNRAYTPNCRGLGCLRPEEMLDDMLRSRSVLHEICDGSAAGASLTNMFRFPGLCHDDYALGLAELAELVVIGADVESGDAFETSARRIVLKTLRRVQNGSIIVFHLTEENAPVTHVAAPVIVDRLRALGFELCRVSEMLSRQ